MCWVRLFAGQRPAAELAGTGTPAMEEPMGNSLIGSQTVRVPGDDGVRHDIQELRREMITRF